MSSFPLRPVSDISPSPSPSSSTSPPAHSKHIMPSPSSRRPLSPGNLRDIDLSHAPDRKYAAPLTGHDLMAMFPPAPPDNFPEMRAGPTSGYFRRQERAFFAQAGKEIVRVRLEVDLQNGAPDHPHDTKAAIRPHAGSIASSASRSWLPPNAQASPTQASSSAHHSPSSSTASGTPPALYPHTGGPTASPSAIPGSLTSSRSSQRGAAVAPTAGPGAAPPYQLAPALHAAPPPPHHHPHHLHAAAHQQHPHPHAHSHSHSHGHSMRTPPHDHMQPPAPPQQQLLGGPPPPGAVPKSEFAHPPPPGMVPHPEDYEPDDAWKRPMPYAERRRAGKHTKRVIVKT